MDTDNEQNNSCLQDEYEKMVYLVSQAYKNVGIYKNTMDQHLTNIWSHISILTNQLGELTIQLEEQEKINKELQNRVKYLENKVNEYRRTK